MRTRWVAALLAPVVLLACGSDDSSESTSAATVESEATDAAESDAPATDAPATEPPATEPPATEPPATEAVETDPPATQPPATDPATTDAAAAGDVAVMLDEWLVDTPTELTAGETTFQIQNDGSFPHEFVVIAGDGYESLPLASNGAVLEDELPAGAVVDRTDRIQGGLAGELTVDLAPGNYVLLCNIVVGPTSHAGQGQTLDVTVG